MDIEDSNTFNEPADDGFVIDPVEISLPSFGLVPKRSVQKRETPKRNRKKDTENREIVRVFTQRLCKTLEDTKDKYITAKVQKLSMKIWDIISIEKEKFAPFRIIKLNMPSNCDHLLESLYRSLTENVNFYSINCAPNIISINQPAPNVGDLIETSVRELERVEKDLRKTGVNINSTEHVFVFLFSAHFNQYIDFLDDFMKHLSEEVIGDATNIKIFMVFPSFPTLTKA